MSASPLPAHRRTAAHFLILIGAFALVSLLALLAVRIEHLSPDARLIIPHFFGQLLGLHRTLLHYFVLIPVLPAAVGLGLLPDLLKSEGLAFPRLARTALLSLGAGGALVLWSFIWGRIEPGWAHALASPMADHLVSPLFLCGLLLACLSIQLIAINLIATLHSAGLRNAPLAALAFYAAAWMLVLAVPLEASALALGLMHKALPALISAESGPSLAALIHGLSAAPLQWAVLLCAVGAACLVLKPEALLPRRTLRFMRAHVAAFAVLGLLATDARALPGSMSAPLAMLGALYSVLLLVPLFGLAAPLFEAALLRRAEAGAQGLHVAAALLLMTLFAPLQAFLSLPAAGYLAVGYLSSSAYYLLFGGSCLLALLGALYAGRSPRSESPPSTSGIFAGGVLIFGLLATFGPMIPLGLQGLSMDLAAYPPQHMALQVLVFAGSTILAIGLLASALAVKGRTA